MKTETPIMDRWQEQWDAYYETVKADAADESMRPSLTLNELARRLETSHAGLVIALEQLLERYSGGFADRKGVIREHNEARAALLAARSIAKE